MYDIRQFRPTFYLVMLLAFAAYGIALESPPHLAGGLLLLALHALLVFRGSTFQVPRRIASALAILTGAWSLLGLVRGSMEPLLAVSQWLFLLVLIILYSRRDNRAYGQMLVMSLVLMVAGAIYSASLFFAILLIAYLFLALFCCLLFHLKVETEYATRAYSLSDRPPVEGALRHDQRHFSRSMRRLTALVSVIAIGSGVLVFVFFPRSKIAPALAMGSPARREAMTGFSERMGFEQVARITQNDDLVAQVSMMENGKPLQLGEVYLRGLALDVYTGRSSRSRQYSWQWVRSAETNDGTDQRRLVPGQLETLARAPGARQIEQTILLRPTGTSTLFSLSGVTAIAADSALDIQHSPADGSVQTTDVLRVPIRYKVISTGSPPPPFSRDSLVRPPLPSYMAYGTAQRYAPTSPTASQIDPKITEYALRPDVSGSDAQGPLAARRPKSATAPTPLDEPIAASIARHLQTQFRYTLDLSSAGKRPLHDPMVDFLYELKRGHCEYFAGAMTLMCQSLGLKARVVIGFRASGIDYNNVGDYYMIKQSNAHAWVEVLTPQGWTMFDPTSGDIEGELRHTRSFFAPISDFFDYLQYKWAASVVAYDNQDLSVISNLEAGITRSMETGSSWTEFMRRFLNSERGYEWSTRVLAGAVVLSLVALVGSIIIYAVKRASLDRRAQRIGLGALPSGDRLRLARQLRFYDELLQLLARQRIGRPPHLTPREFASALSFLPPEVYEKVGQVTEVFYRVRYGNESLAPDERRTVQSLIGEIAAGLPGRAV